MNQPYTHAIGRVTFKYAGGAFGNGYRYQFVVSPNKLYAVIDVLRNNRVLAFGISSREAGEKAIQTIQRDATEERNSKKK